MRRPSSQVDKRKEKRAHTRQKPEAHRTARPAPQVVAWAKAHFETNRELYEWLAKL